MPESQRVPRIIEALRASVGAEWRAEALRTDEDKFVLR
jgi:hypothetical protein